MVSAARREAAVDLHFVEFTSSGASKSPLQSFVELEHVGQRLVGQILELGDSGRVDGGGLREQGAGRWCHEKQETTHE